MKAVSIIPPDTLVHRDATEFGHHIRQGGWRLGLLVARCVFAGKPSARINAHQVEIGKVSTSVFARQAGIDQKTVQRYLNAWDLAAESGLVKRAADLAPGDEPEISVEELPAWSLFSSPQEEEEPAEEQEPKPKVESKGRRTATAKKVKKPVLDDPFIEFKVRGKYTLVIRSLDGSQLPDERVGVLNLLDMLREQLAMEIEESK
jgi:hypothetical protein